MCWRKFAAAVTLLLLLPAFGARCEGPVVAFWNLENYFDPFDDPLADDGDFTPRGKKRWSWNKFILKRNGIAKTILAMSDSAGRLPDVVAFAEVENRMVLKQLVKETPLEKYGYGIVHRNSPDRRGIDVALIYRKERFRVIAVDSIRVASSSPTRDILYVKGVFHPSDTVHLLVNHWPSKVSSGSGSRRVSAAAALCRTVDSILFADPGAGLLALGDFNDTPDNVAPLLDGALRPLADSLFAAGRGTIRYKGRWELIDQCYTTLPDARMLIFDAPFLLEEDADYLGVKPRRTYLGQSWKGGLSDHLPILILQ